MTNERKRKVVFIPGLGFDSRIFENLELPNSDKEYLNWIEPNKNENLHDYSLRLFEKYKDSKEEFILIGHSLGGIVAQEIAAVYPIQKVILISSIKSREELPFHFKVLKFFRLDRLLTKRLCVKSVKYWGKNHGFNTPEDRELFKSMVSRQSNFYLKWALRQLTLWRGVKLKPHTKLIHIHGTNDKTLLFKSIKNPDFIIENGSHFMVYKRPEEVSKIISKFVRNDPII